jgi:hypothetical protein
MSGWAYGYRWATEPYMAWQNYWADSTTVVSFKLNTLDFPNLTDYVRPRRDYIQDNSCSGFMNEPICSAFWDDVNKKKKGYTPYTYPHPLTGGGSIPAPPAAPSHLRIIR